MGWQNPSMTGFGFYVPMFRRYIYCLGGYEIGDQVTGSLKNIWVDWRMGEISRIQESYDMGSKKNYHDHRMTHFEWNLMRSVRVMRTTHPYSIHLHQWLVMPWATLHVSLSFAQCLMPELIYASNVSTLFFDPFTFLTARKDDNNRKCCHHDLLGKCAICPSNSLPLLSNMLQIMGKIP